MPFKISGGGSFGLPMLGRGRAPAGGGGGDALPVTEGLYADYDASTLGLVDGSVLTDWPDGAGDNNLGLPTGLPRYRSNGINGEPAVEFDNASLFTVDFGEALPQPNTVIVVATFDQTADANQLVDGSRSGSRHALYLLTDGSIAMFASAPFDTYSSLAEIDTPYVISGVFNGASSVLSVNKSAEAVEVGTHGLDGLRVGANVSANNHHDGMIARILIYSTGLSSAALLEVEDYLMSKYAIS